MLWSFHIPSLWENKSTKSSWKDVYTFCMEVERDVNSKSYDIDITDYWVEGIRLYGKMEDVERSLKDKGYFVDTENKEIFVPCPFNYRECLGWLKIAISEIFGDDSVELAEGSYEDFCGTNIDSVASMMATEEMKKLRSEADKEAGGDLWEYLKKHPDLMLKMGEVKKKDEPRCVYGCGSPVLLDGVCEKRYNHGVC